MLLRHTRIHQASTLFIWLLFRTLRPYVIKQSQKWLAVKCPEHIPAGRRIIYYSRVYLPLTRYRPRHLRLLKIIHNCVISHHERLFKRQLQTFILETPKQTLIYLEPDTQTRLRLPEPHPLKRTITLYSQLDDPHLSLSRARTKAELRKSLRTDNKLFFQLYAHNKVCVELRGSSVIFLCLNSQAFDKFSSIYRMRFNWYSCILGAQFLTEMVHCMHIISAILAHSHGYLQL